jgi:hypothetical protein
VDENLRVVVGRVEMQAVDELLGEDRGVAPQQAQQTEAGQEHEGALAGLEEGDGAEA